MFNAIQFHVDWTKYARVYTILYKQNTGQSEPKPVKLI